MTLGKDVLGKPRIPMRIKSNGFTPGWGHWIKSIEFESSSTPGKKYTTKVWKDGRITCNCPAWIYRRDCPHIRIAKEVYTRKPRRVLTKKGRRLRRIHA